MKQFITIIAATILSLSLFANDEDSSSKLKAVKFSIVEIKKTNSKATLINWSVDKTIRVDRFEIEKSGNGRDWQLAGIVFGADNVEVDGIYLFKEKTGNQKITYRVRQIDMNGNAQFVVVKRTTIQ